MDATRSNNLKVVLTTDAIKYPLTGIGRYTYELAQNLKELELDDLLFLNGAVLQPHLPRSSRGTSLSQQQSFKKIIRNSRLASSIFRELNGIRQGYALNRKSDYIFHGTNYHLPHFSGPSVVTIHDLSPFLWPDHHPPERVRYMQSAILNSLKKATAIITDTEYTRKEIAEYFSYPLNRIHAVPLASGPEFKLLPIPQIQHALSQYALQAGSYTLYTGTVEPRKNLGVLLDAYARLPNDLRRQWPLVVAGHHGWQSDNIHTRLKTAENQGWARYLGFVPQEALPPLMAGARLFLYPSLYEGFGLPVLEAMACGTPVICSNASTLPEVAGNAAAFHEPNDVDTLVSLIEEALENEAWRTGATSTGLVQANKFSWRRCAEQTYSVYCTIRT